VLHDAETQMFVFVVINQLNAPILVLY